MIEEAFVGTARLSVLGKLGQGGMGVVYRAFDAERGVEVALKTLPRLDAAGILRFKREFRALADVTHPNLVAYHELFEDAGRWFFTMELLEGEDLLSYARRAIGPEQPPTGAALGDAPTITSFEVVDDASIADVLFTTHGGIIVHALDEPRLRSALEQLARAVDAVHAAGKLHRDIKPSNALVTRAGRVVLLDFGLARDADRDGVDEGVLGTPAYMAPEQAAGYEATKASDWYAVGVVLFEALTGRAPFVGSIPGVLVGKQTEAAPAARGLAPEAPVDLCELADALLARDPTLRPDADEIFRRLGVARVDDGDASAVFAAPREASAPFVGRRDALATLRAAFDEARAGHAVAAVVFGPSGVGKSALVGRFLADARAAGALVLTGRCYEQESVPYKALDSLVDELSTHLAALAPDDLAALVPQGAAELARVFPVLRRVRGFMGPPTTSDRGEQADLRRRAFRALRWMLTALSSRAPLVLAIDDIQWGDVDSARLLVDILSPHASSSSGTAPDPRLLVSPAMLAVGAFRSEAVAESLMLGELDRARTEGRLRRVHDVELAALTEDEAFDLAASMLGEDDERARAEARRIARESEGSPFFVGELVRFSAARGDHERRPSLEEVVRARVDALDDDARRVLEVTAIAGQPTPQRLVVQATLACRQSGPLAPTWPLALDGAAVFAKLRAASLVRSYGVHGADNVEPYHDRVRESVARALDADARRTIHRALAYVLGDVDGVDPERLAMHHDGAGDRASALKCARAAADAAAEALAFDRAARLYAWVLERAPTPSASDPRARRAARDRAIVHRRLGDALAAAGRGRDAAHAFLAAAPAEAPEVAAELHRRAAEQLLVSGHLDEGLEILERVLTAVGLDVPKTPARAL
ncbi:MAG TPA: protein kinase, partial [Byssovorax sp.]